MQNSQLNQEDDDDEYHKQQRQITKLIDRYRQKRKNNVLKQITNALYYYEQLLQTNYASPAKWAWLSDRKNEVNNLRTQKAIQNQQSAARNFVTVDHIKVLAQQNQQSFQNMQKDVQQAIQISTLIKAQLDKQIQDLDRVYEQNKDINVKIKRSMTGLRTILRRIFMSKLTRCLAVVTVLSIIALIVVFILKNNGKIL